MHQPTFHFHNDYGIPFPAIGAGVREEGIFFRRYVGLVYPGKNDSIIGRGGSGVIHVVRDKIMDRVVALKLPNESILAEPQVRNEVLNEASQALELTHPNIVRIYDFHDQDSRWGISMQYVRGRNLDEWRDKLAPHQMSGGSFYDVDQIKAWVLQLCDALSYAHEEAGIAHCDIKPRNLLLERSFDTRVRQIREKLLLTDFGITQKLRDFTTRTQKHNLPKSSPGGTGDEGGAAGTLAYMSPQQLLGNDSAISDDIYAVGVTLYELLTGRPPFYQGDAKIIQHQIESVVPPAMMARRHERGVKAATPIPDLWEQVTAQCLHKDAAKRPASARELARLLGLSAASVSAISPAEERRREEERETLRVTVHTQEKKISELTDHLQQLEIRQAGKVDESQLNQARAEITRLETALQEKDAQLNELDEQIQDLEEERNALQRQLDASGNSSSETAALLAQERDAAAARLQKAQAEAARIQEERDTARATLKKSEQALEDLRSKLADAVKEAAEAGNKAKTADARIQKAKDEEAATRKTLEAARAQAEQKLAQARQEADEARRQAESLSEKQTAPLRPVLLMLAGMIVLGVIIGAGIGWSSGGSGAGDVSALVARVQDSKSFIVLKSDVQAYLRQVGLDDGALGPHFAALGADAPATGLSWLEAAAFCEWLTRATGKDSSKEWFDLPRLDEAAAAGKDLIQEWTREEATAPANNGVNRAMRVYDHSKPQAQQNLSLPRTEKNEAVGFRCVLREAT